MKVVILCGGKGTRIRGIADDIPKPMIQIGGRPILWHIMKHYAGFGHTEFVLCLGYRGAEIRSFFLDYHTRTSDFTVTLGEEPDIEFHDPHQEAGWRVTLADTGTDTLTGSRLKRVEPYLAEDEDFLLTYGDGVSDIDLAALVGFHRAHGKIMTVSGVRPPSRFGEMVHDETGAVTEFNEKPQAVGGLISGGFFVCRREMFNYIDSGRDDQMLELEPMQRLVDDDQMSVYRHDGFWQCMDTPRDYELLNRNYARAEAPWVTW